MLRLPSPNAPLITVDYGDLDMRVLECDDSRGWATWIPSAQRPAKLSMHTHEVQSKQQADSII
jgi:hypothetical protein